MSASQVPGRGVREMKGEMCLFVSVCHGRGREKVCLCKECFRCAHVFLQSSAFQRRPCTYGISWNITEYSRKKSYPASSDGVHRNRAGLGSR